MKSRGDISSEICIGERESGGERKREESRPISISRVNRSLEKMTTPSTTSSSVSFIAFTFLARNS